MKPVPMNLFFPMVVGPRYIPGNATGQQAADGRRTRTRFPMRRALRRSRRVHYGVKGTRAGHDISLAVKLDAGVPSKNRFEFA